MTFDELDSRMRIFETNDDRCVLPGIHIVARLDGRGFTRLTKVVHQFEAPFDERFRDIMVQTVEHLMDCGFRVVYGYTESDEISLLFHAQERSFGRKTRKIVSILAGEASAKCSLLLRGIAAFDCRISQLPAEQDVVDYFRWRNEDAHRNALNAHCYWSLRREGTTADEATTALLHLTVAEKNELLFQRGVNFNELPLWQRRGVGVVWEEFERSGIHGLTGEAVAVKRRRLARRFELPMRDEYSAFIQQLLDAGMC